MLSLVVQWMVLWREERALRMRGGGGARLVLATRVLMETEAALAGRIGAEALAGLTEALYREELARERAA